MAETKTNTTQKDSISRPFLKWAGGKRQLLDVLVSYVPPFHRYYEPFLGGGALFFALQPKNATLNDLNRELINTYKTVKTNVEELIEELAKYQNSTDFYYKVRNLDRNTNFKSLTPIQHAARFIYLNHTCYNGLYRVNSKGQFNTPFGRYRNPTIFDKNNLRLASGILQKGNIRLLSEDFANVLKKVREGDFVYLDPPYDTVKGDSFTSYQKNGFTKEDQIRLKKTLDVLSEKHVRFLLSNAATDFILELYKDYHIEIVKAKRAINSKAEGRGAVDEVLVMNYG